MSDLDDRFKEAADRVMGLPNRPPDETLLELYGLFKQGSEGDVRGSRPGFFDLRGRAKFDAWASRKGMSRESAKEAYVELVDRLGG